MVRKGGMSFVKRKIHPKLQMGLKLIGSFILILFSNLYLQWCQNNLSVELALKFAFSWHTEKFFLACLVLLLFYGLLTSLAGSLGVGALFYSIVIGILGYANYLKMAYRQEPIYPDDLKMITQFAAYDDRNRPLRLGDAMCDTRSGGNYLEYLSQP